MRLHAFVLVVFCFLHCKGHYAPESPSFDLVSTPKGTSPGWEPSPGEAREPTGSGSAPARETSTPPGALAERTSPGRRHPAPGFENFPRFSYPESYRDHVYRDLSKRAKEIFFLITVRKYDLVGIRPLCFCSIPK